MMKKNIYIYRSKHPVKNFKIKATLKKFGPRLADFEIFYDTKDAEKCEKNEERSFEEYIFSWQEKAFSMKEIEKYSNDSITYDNLEKKYFEEIKELKRNKSAKLKPHRLYTYVNQDPFTQKSLSVLKKSDKNQRNTTISESASCSMHAPSVMYIMADLRPPSILDPGKDEDSDKSTSKESEKDNQTDIDAETVLCKLTYSKHGVLSLKPDFTRDNPPYVITTCSDNELYEYKLEHVSVQMSKEQLELEQSLVEDYLTKRQEALQSKVGFDFQEPNSNRLRLCCNIEIMAAKDFEYDHLYVTWFVDCAQEWKSNSCDSLYGCTHTCSTRKEGNSRVAHFSMPFSVDLERVVIDRGPIQPPRVLFEVSSYDTWDRFRIEGYAHLCLSLEAGSTEHKLQCWRPAEEDRHQLLRRFLVGNLLQLDDLSYVGMPLEHKGSCLNKIDFKSLSTGLLLLRSHSVLQTHEAIKDKVRDEASRFVDENKPGASWNITRVLDAFKRSKMRMRRARESVQKELLEWS